MHEARIGCKRYTRFAASHIRSILRSEEGALIRRLMLQILASRNKRLNWWWVIPLWHLIGIADNLWVLETRPF